MRFPLAVFPLLAAFVVTVCGAFAQTSADQPPAGGIINNAELIPRILPDREVAMHGKSPEWVASLIMAEFRVETATPEGTFAAAVRVLDHYAEMGVNGLWICPVWERGSKKNGYANNGPASLEPLMTGGGNFEESCAAVRRFVEEAHRRNIRVVFDIVVWGTRKEAPLVSEHPEFYRRLPDGSFWEVWGGYGFDWTNAALRGWYRAAAVDFILNTGADGYRVDLAPDTSGYFFQEVRDELYAKGRKIILISEMPNERREVFDFEQNGVTGWTEEPDHAHPERLREQTKRFGHHNEAPLRANLVEMVRSGTGIGSATLQKRGQGGAFQYYTQNLLNHDDGEPFVKGSRVRFGYTAVFAPLLPLWWIGEEWNNPKRLLGDAEGGVMFFNTIDWSTKETPQNRAFFEDVKRFIRIRRTHPDIFEVFPGDARQAKILSLDSKRDGAPNPLQAYARFGRAKAVLIVPNHAGPKAESEFEIRVPSDKLNIPFSDSPSTKPRITDLLTGKRLDYMVSSPDAVVKVTIANDALAVLLMEPN